MQLIFTYYIEYENFQVQMKLIDSWCFNVKDKIINIMNDEECQSTFKNNVNKMSIQPTYDAMPTRYNINDARILTPFRVDTILTNESYRVKVDTIVN